MIVGGAFEKAIGVAVGEGYKGCGKSVQGSKACAGLVGGVVITVVERLSDRLMERSAN